MGTRSLIAMKKNGKYEYIYCHWDGYPEYNGKILRQHYKDSKKVKQLIELGDISSLRRNIGKKHDFDKMTRGDTDYYEEIGKKGWTTAYSRDRGEKGSHLFNKQVSSKQMLIEKAKDFGAEYIYVYEKGKWTGYDNKGYQVM